MTDAKEPRTTTTLRVFVDGTAFWAPTLPGWDIARAAFIGDVVAVDPPLKRPSPDLLAPAERRRAPDSVALALEVASAAARDADRDPTTLASVFTSAHGDLAVNDYMCTTLATAPTQLSPTRFHNSVHNAASGYWTIGTGCHATSTALTAFDCSFAAGLLEAATQCAAGGEAVLLVAFDVQAVGALSTVTTSDGLLAAALVLVPQRGPRTRAGFELTLQSGPAEPVALRSPAARALAGNAMADALPLFEALAGRAQATLALPLSASLALRLVPIPD